MKHKYGRLQQSDSNAPTLFGEFGDTTAGGATLSFASNEQHQRLGTGEYLVHIGDDLMDSQGNVPFRGHIQVTLHQNAVAVSIKAGVQDVNYIEVRTFDAAGNPCDVGGDFYLQLDLNDEGF